MPYTPKADGTLSRTLAEWSQFFRKDGKPNPVIEAMDQSNTILDDMKWLEASDSDGNRTTVRTGLPQVYWRQLYKGVPPSKSTVTTIKDPVGMLEGRSLIDIKLLKLHESQQKAYRFQEIKAFGEAMRQELATAVFYGDIKSNPLGINGLAKRYAFRNAPQVIDAGGRGAECTSMFGVVWGDRDVTGLFPKDSKAGFEHENLGTFDAMDEEGNAYRATGDLVSWHVGLAVCDWRSVVRICNIPMTALHAKVGDADFIDLHRLTIIAKNKILAEKRADMVWYVNQDVMTALELQASDAGHVHLTYQDMFRSKSVPHIHGAPVRQCDAILTAEAALDTL